MEFGSKFVYDYGRHGADSEEESVSDGELDEGMVLGLR